MEARVYCIYDLKAEAPVNSVFKCMSTDAEAVRMFGQLLSDRQGGLVADHPADFALVCVGTVDFSTLQFLINPGSRYSPVITGDACVRALARARAGITSDSDGESAGGVVNTPA